MRRSEFNSEAPISTEIVTLTRLETGDQGTFGKIFFLGRTLYTGELPWKGNASNVSCIPPGIYECVQTWSPRFSRPLYLVEGVANRLGIRIHPANFMGTPPQYHCQLNGCIALGEKLGFMDGQKAVLVSRPAVTQFENALSRQRFTLEIILSPSLQAGWDQDASDKGG